MGIFFQVCGSFFSNTGKNKKQQMASPERVIYPTLCRDTTENNVKDEGNLPQTWKKKKKPQNTVASCKGGVKEAASTRGHSHSPYPS